MGWQKGWTLYPVDGSQPILHEEPQLHKPDEQNIKELWADFLNAIRTGKRPNADIEEGHRSTIVCQIANISYRLDGRRLQQRSATLRLRLQQALAKEQAQCRQQQERLDQVEGSSALQSQADRRTR